MPWRRNPDDRQIDRQTDRQTNRRTHRQLTIWAWRWVGQKAQYLAQDPRLTCDEIMNALTFKDLMCRNNDELVTRQKFLKRKIMSIRLLACRILEDIHDGRPDADIWAIVRTICFGFTWLPDGIWRHLVFFYHFQQRIKFTKQNWKFKASEGLFSNLNRNDYHWAGKLKDMLPGRICLCHRSWHWHVALFSMIH